MKVSASSVNGVAAEPPAHATYGTRAREVSRCNRIPSRLAAGAHALPGASHDRGRVHTCARPRMRSARIRDPWPSSSTANARGKPSTPRSSSRARRRPARARPRSRRCVGRRRCARRRRPLRRAQQKHGPRVNLHLGCAPPHARAPSGKFTGGLYWLMPACSRTLLLCGKFSTMFKSVRVPCLALACRSRIGRMQ